MLALAAKTCYLFEHIMNSYKIHKFDFSSKTFVTITRTESLKKNPSLENESSLYIQEFPHSL